MTPAVAGLFSLVLPLLNTLLWLRSFLSWACVGRNRSGDWGRIVKIEFDRGTIVSLFVVACVLMVLSRADPETISSLMLILRKLLAS